MTRCTPNMQRSTYRYNQDLPWLNERTGKLIDSSHLVDKSPDISSGRNVVLGDVPQGIAWLHHVFHGLRKIAGQAVAHETMVDKASCESCHSQK